ncbi:MAG: hypothetical protein ACLFVT_00550 [Syntrophobacteria bacterium]
MDQVVTPDETTPGIIFERAKMVDTRDLLDQMNHVLGKSSQERGQPNAKQSGYLQGYLKGYSDGKAHSRARIEQLEKEIAQLQGRTQDHSPLQAKNEWLRVLPNNMIALILGIPGSGKSACGYRILELMKESARPYVFNFPEGNIDLLPEWIGVATDFGAIPPTCSVILVDEAHLSYHARTSALKQQTQALVEEIGSARHRDHSLIFVCHRAEFLDKIVSRYANTVIFKKPGLASPRLDPEEFRDVAERAGQFFKDIKNHHKFCYVSTDGFEGSLQIDLPSFWSEELSRAYAGGKDVAVAGGRKPKSLDNREKKIRAREWKADGASYTKIARGLGVSRSTVVRWCRD